MNPVYRPVVCSGVRRVAAFVCNVNDGIHLNLRDRGIIRWEKETVYFGLHNFYFLQNIIGPMKLWRMKWIGHVTRTGDECKCSLWSWCISCDLFHVDTNSVCLHIIENTSVNLRKLDPVIDRCTFNVTLLRVYLLLSKTQVK
jgi:hypothetical protein